MPHGLAIWSRNAGLNQTADDNAYLQEGQSAPTINNAIRGVMQSAAEWRDDNSGQTVATRGTGEVYTLPMAQLIPDLTLPFTVAFYVDVLNQGPAKLAAGSLPATSIRRRLGRELGPGDFAPSILYRASWIPSIGHYVIVSPDIDKPGKLEHLAYSTSPDPGWLKCCGQAISRTAYAALFAVLGTAYGAGDGSTTFNLPDYAGRSLFGADDMSGAAANRLTGAGGVAGAHGSVGGAETVTLTQAQMPVHTHTASMDAQGDHTHTFSATTAATSTDHSHTYSGTTGSENADHGHGLATVIVSTAPDHTHGVNTGAVNVVNSVSSSASISMSFTGVSDDIFAASGAGGAHSHSLSGVTQGVDRSHQHAYSGTTSLVSANATHTHTLSGTTGSSGTHFHTITVNGIGGGLAHSNMPPAAVVTIVIKA